MKSHELKPAEGSRKECNHVGHGVATGNGKTSGRGHKGQKARSGSGVRLGFESGRLSLLRRLPERGFTNVNREEYAIINLDQLNKFEDDTEVTPTLLVESGVVKNEKFGIRIPNNGSPDKKLIMKAHRFSASAAEAIDAKDGAHKVI